MIHFRLIEFLLLHLYAKYHFSIVHLDHSVFIFLAKVPMILSRFDLTILIIR